MPTMELYEYGDLYLDAAKQNCSTRNSIYDYATIGATIF